MSLKVFLRLFIALIVIAEGRSQNQSDCVKFERDKKFSFNFFPESLRGDQTVWENALRKITNYTNDCLQSYLFNKSKHPCKDPRIIITFPVISGNPKIPLKVLPRPYLATREASSSTFSQVLVQIWKLFVLCLVAAAISGVIIWFLVSIDRKLMLYLRKAFLFLNFTDFYSILLLFSYSMPKNNWICKFLYELFAAKKF